MRTLTKQDCRAVLEALRPKQLGAKGKDVYSRLFQEAYGVPFEMVVLLRKSSNSIASLEKKLKMSRRTVFRYLNALEKVGCDLELSEAGYRIAKVGPQLAPVMKTIG